MRPLTQEEADLATSAHEEQMDRYRERIEKTFREQQAVYEEMAERFVPPAAYEETIRRLSGELIDIQIEVVGLEARNEAALRAIAKMSELMEQRITENDVVAKLGQLVQLRKEFLAEQEAQYNQGITSNLQLRNSRELLLSAEADLARQIEQVRQQNGIDVIADMNQQLLDIEIQRAELGARESVIQNRLDAAQELISLFQAYKMNSLTIEAIQEEATKIDGQYIPTRAGDPVYDLEKAREMGLMGGMGGMGMPDSW